MFKVSEIAEKLGKTKDSVYKKSSRLKRELKGHKKTLNGVVYYDVEGFEIIKNSYETPVSDEDDVKSCPNTTSNDYLNMLLSDKDKQIGHLKEMLSKQEKSLEQAMELVKNNQVLLLQSQERVLMLESTQIDEKKSFWSKFKK